MQQRLKALCLIIGCLITTNLWAVRAPTITTNSLPSGQTTVSYSATVLGKWGTKPYTWAITSGSLPTSLSLNASTGVISGTPTVAGTFSFFIRLTDSEGSPKTYTQQLYILISASAVVPATPVQITTTSPLPNGLVSSAYTTTVQAVDGTSPYTWSVSAGTLPAGLSLAASTGVISGTPTAPGTSSFSIKVTDSATNPSTATQQLSVTISNPVPAPTYLFTDGFESGNFAAWTGLQSSSGTYPPTVQSTIKHSGTYAYSQHYYICGDSTNPACGAAHQDYNRYIEKDFNASNGYPNGLEHFFVRGYVMFHLNSGGTQMPQRKLIYMKDPSTSAANYSWCAVLTTMTQSTDGTGGALQFRMAGDGGPYNPFGMTPWAFYNLSPYTFDTWYALEIEVQANTPGLSDGQVRVWVNGSKVLDQSGMNLRGTATTGVTRIEIGRQADRFGYTNVDELRYWDDIIINTTGPIGP